MAVLSLSWVAKIVNLGEEQWGGYSRGHSQTVGRERMLLGNNRFRDSRELLIQSGKCFASRNVMC